MLPGHTAPSDAKGRRSPVVLGALCAVVAALVALAIAFGSDLWAFFSDGEAVRAWAEGQGALAPAAMAALVCAQVVVAVLPGEPVELACGYVLGFWEGTAACLAGSCAGTLAVVALVRVFGMRVVRLFFSQEKLDSVSWLKDTARFELVLLVVFLIPGTPKDVLTYAAGLTEVPWWKIAALTTVGRIPSIVTSTLASGLASEGSWALAALVLAVTVVLALAGAAAFAFVGRRSAKK